MNSKHILECLQGGPVAVTPSVNIIVLQTVGFLFPDSSILNVELSRDTKLSDMDNNDNEQ